MSVLLKPKVLSLVVIVYLYASNCTVRQDPILHANWSSGVRRSARDRTLNNRIVFVSLWNAIPGLQCYASPKSIVFTCLCGVCIKVDKSSVGNRHMVVYTTLVRVSMDSIMDITELEHFMHVRTLGCVWRKTAIDGNLDNVCVRRPI